MRADSARLVADGGTRFELWAPDASRVDVRIERTGAADDVDVQPLTRALDAVAELDTWSIVVDGVGHGDRYRYRLDGGDWLARPGSAAGSPRACTVLDFEQTNQPCDSASGPMRGRCHSLPLRP